MKVVPTLNLLPTLCTDALWQCIESINLERREIIRSITESHKCLGYEWNITSPTCFVIISKTCATGSSKIYINEFDDDDEKQKRQTLASFSISNYFRSTAKFINVDVFVDVAVVVLLQLSKVLPPTQQRNASLRWIYRNTPKQRHFCEWMNECFALICFPKKFQMIWFSDFLISQDFFLVDSTIFYDDCLFFVDLCMCLYLWFSWAEPSK